MSTYADGITVPQVGDVVECIHDSRHPHFGLCDRCQKVSQQALF